MQAHTYHGPAITGAAPGTYATPTPARSMNLRDAAALLCVSDRHLRRLAADGTLRTYRVGRCIRVTETAIAEFQQRAGA